MAEKEKSIHAGHRERLRQRLRTAGLSAFSEHEVLELLLTYAIPQRDVNPLAHELIAVFGSLNAVLSADENELLRVKGMGKSAALFLTMMPQLARYCQMNALGERPVIVTLHDARTYCAPLFFGVADRIAQITLKSFTKCLIIRMRGVPAVDATAMQAMEALLETCKKKDVRLILSHVNEQPYHMMEKSGFADRLGRENFCQHIDDALALAETVIAAEAELTV